VDDVNGMSLSDQPPAKYVGERKIVLDEQQPHAHTVASGYEAMAVMTERRRLLPRTLRGRVVTVYAAFLTVAVVLGLLGGYLALDRILRSVATEELTARLDDLTAAIESNDSTPVRRDPYAQLVAGGSVIVRSSAAPATPVLSPGESATVRRDTQLFRRAAPGLSDDGLLAARTVNGGDTLVVGASLTTVETASRRILIGLLALAPLLILALTLGVRRLVGTSLRPIAALTNRAAKLSTTSAGQRLPEPPTDDEVGTLARTLNGMLDRIDAANQRERMFIDDAAHELRTPVAVLRAELELGLTDAEEGNARRALQAALAEADRLTRLSDDLLVLARARTDSLDIERAPTDVTTFVRQTLARLERPYPVALTVTGEEIVANVDASRLEQVISNLVSNAAHAGASAVRIQVEQPAAGGVDLTVCDDGPGFPADLLPLSFDRFNRRTRARTRSGGTGLGLAIVASIVQAHGGRVEAANGSDLGGAQVSIHLPDATPHPNLPR
jgi:two-component system, OmpR family, sensor kinase